MSTIYVYDKENYFFLFLKKKFSGNYHFIKLNDVELMSAHHYDKNDAGIFIANNVNDVLAFFRFRECFHNRILLCTEKPIICEKYKKALPLTFLDISKPKKQFYQELIFRIETLLDTTKF